jgi:hypothetical protein
MSSNSLLARRSRNQIVLVLELVLVLDSLEGSRLPAPPGVVSNAPTPHSQIQTDSDQRVR